MVSAQRIFGLNLFVLLETLQDVLFREHVAHEDFDEIDLPENQISSTKCAQYDLEKYELPAAIRKILKK